MKQYLVQTHDDTDQVAYTEFLNSLGVEIGEDYSHFPTLYLVTADNVQLELLKNNKETKEVEPANKHAMKFSRLDEVGNVVETGENAPSAGVFAVGEQKLGTNDNWGLGRIDEHERYNLSTYIYNNSGVGVDVYVIDSGISNHVDIAGRINNLWTAYSIFEDEDGHGTHVASTIGGERYGVAKDVMLHNVKVFDASVSAPITTIVSGCNAALSHHKSKVNNGINRPSVVNMSLGGDGSMLNTVVAEMQKAGMVVCVAAGNASGDLDNSINVYPAESPNVLTVNALNDQDRASYFNNYGSACDIFAPGERIKAADYNNLSGGWASMSGTSMATPHVAGVCALALEGKPIFTTKEQVDAFFKYITDYATQNMIVFDGVWEGYDSRFQNKIVYSLLSYTTEPAPAPEPTPEPAPEPTPVPSPGADKGKKKGKKWLLLLLLIAGAAAGAAFLL